MNNTARKLFALLLCLVMVLSFFPTSALAEEGEDAEVIQEEENDCGHAREDEGEDGEAPDDTVGDDAPGVPEDEDAPEEAEVVISEPIEDELEPEDVSSDYQLTGDPRTDLLLVALAQEGKTASDFGFTLAWCSYFVSWCGLIAAPDLFPSSLQPYGKDLVVNMANNNHGVLYYFDDAGYASLNNGDPYVNFSTGNYVRTDRSSFTPEPGDLITFCNSEYEFKHIGIVCAVDADNVYYIDGNGGGDGAGTTMTRPVRTYVPIARDSSSISTYLRPNYTSGTRTDVINSVDVSIDDPSVFLKQESGSKQCTLIANVMMLRRRAIIDGDSAWSSITGSSVGNVAWSSSGMAFEYTYGGKRVYSYGMSSELNLSLGDLNGKKQYLIDNLITHPEGIVIYVHHNSSYKHAVLLTDYDAAADTFYCADPAPSVASGRIKLSDSLLPSYVKQSYPNTGLSDQDLVIAYTQQTWMIIEGSGPISDSNPPTISGAVYPSGTLTQGENFGLRGIISSGSKLINVSAYVYNASGTAVLSYSTNPNSYSYNIQTGGLNDAIAFGGLASGSYRYVVKATNSNGTATLIDSSFSIGGTSGGLVSMNDPSVFLKQESGSKQCTLIANVMMLRRRAILDGDSAWSSITGSSVGDVAWSSSGMVFDYTYGGKHVYSYGMSSELNLSLGDLNGKKQYFIENLITHPEGIVIYVHHNSSYKHAVLLTDYDAATDTFYCADPAPSVASGRIKLSDSLLPSYVKQSYPNTGLSDQDLVIAYTQQTWMIIDGSGATTTYTVSFNANGGTGAPSAQTKTRDVPMTLSSVKPTRANASAGSYTVTLNANGGSVSTTSLTAARTTSYSFKNWNTKADGSGTSYASGGSYTANAAATLYAQWNSSTATAAVTLPTPTRTGYSFKGWATSANATSGTTGSYTPTGNVTLYAIWQAYPYTITFDANGGTGAPAAQTKLHDVALTLSTTKPSRANASAGSYTVTLNANGGSVSTTSLTAARTTSYSFKNWNTKADGSGTSYASGGSYTANAAATLYAQWNSSTATAAVTLPTPTRTGYSFKGWATSANATSGTTGSYTPTGNVTLYAIWQAYPYTITFDANGGTGAPAAQTKLHDVALTLSTTKPTRANASAGSYTVTLNANGGSVNTTSLTAARTTSYTFNNWNTKADGSGTSYASGGSYTANAAATLYAQWNSSTSTAAVTLPTPTREGFTFKGWATSDTATEGIIGSYTPTGNVTLYAIWEQNAPETNAKLVVDGGRVRVGQEIQVPVRIEENPGVVSIEISVLYDETVLEWTAVTPGEYGGTFLGEVGDSLTWYAEDPRENETKDGVFVTLSFRVKEDAAAGTTQVSVSYEEDDIYNADEENQAFQTVPGEIVIYTYIPGDINGDGSVNNKDVLRLQKYLKGQNVEVVEAALDVNGDGKVNNKDATRLARWLKYHDVEIH